MLYILSMHVITRKRLLEFSKKHPDYATSLESWYRIVKHTNFNTFEELCHTFPNADKVRKLTVFNIGGNKVRLIAAIHYNTHRIYIRQFLMHAEYDRGDWKE